jgi:hypothetical protein
MHFSNQNFDAELMFRTAKYLQGGDKRGKKKFRDPCIKNSTAETKQNQARE